MRFAIAGFLAGTAVVSSCLAQDDSVVITAPRFAEETRRLPAAQQVEAVVQKLRQRNPGLDHQRFEGDREPGCFSRW